MRPATAPYHARLIAQRVRYRAGSAPVVAALVGIGANNFGDDWMFEALEQGLPDCRVVEIKHPATEWRLSKIGLSRESLFSGLVVGGGTLINSYFLPRILPFVDAGIPMWTLGTGVGSAGFGVPESQADPTGWAQPLKGCRRVTLRGPYSLAHLERIGVAGGEVVGDLALAHTTDQPLAAWESRKVLVNLSGSADEAAGQGEGMHESDVIRSVAEGFNGHLRDGWEITPFALHDDDFPRLHALGELIGGWPRPPVRLRDAATAMRLLQGARALVGMRLHAAALGWMSGIPTLGIGYRDKTRDFAARLDAEDQVADLRAVTSSELSRAVAATLERTPESVQRPHRNALDSRQRLRLLLTEINAELTTAARHKQPGSGPPRDSM